MEPIGEKLKHLSTELKDYVETRIELLVLTISDRITKWIGNSIQQIFGFSILLVGLIFALTALSIFLGELYNNMPLGFLTVSVPLLIFGFIFFAIKPKSISIKIQDQLMDDIIEMIQEKNDEHERLKLSAKSSDKKEYSKERNHDKR